MGYEKRREATRRALIEAFLILFRKKNIEKISVGEIVRLADFNRSTFYVYFRDVYDVLAQCEELLVDTITENFDELLTAICNSENPIPEVILEKVISKIVHNNKSIFTTLCLRKPHEVSDIVSHVIIDLLKERYPDFSSDAEDRIRQLLTYHFSALSGLINYWNQKDDYQLDDACIKTAVQIGGEGVITCLRRQIQFIQANSAG